MTQQQQTARQKLGEVIRFHREQRSKSHQLVSRTCSAPVSDVEAWDAGTIVPTSDQWSKLKRSVHHGLAGYAELYQRARAEEQTERDNITRSMNMRAPIPTTNTNGHRPASRINGLGDKLAGIIVPTPSSTRPTPDSPTAIPDARTVNPGQAVSYVEVRPTPERRTRAQMPGGAMSSAEIERRKSYVRDLLTKRPKMRTSGADSVLEDVRRVFGVGISPDVVEEIREQIKQAQALAVLPQTTIALMNAEQAQRELDAKFAAMTRAAQAAQPTGAVNHDDLEAAVQLVLGAVPNLRTFSIAVDEHGEASIDYTVREVVVRETAGSLKVRRG